MAQSTTRRISAADLQGAYTLLLTTPRQRRTRVDASLWPWQLALAILFKRGATPDEIAALYNLTVIQVEEAIREVLRRQ
jgi:DNA-binding NarL/FixJ family response regulator